MIEQRQTEDLADAFMEAYDRGPAWKEAIRKSMDQIEDGLPIGAQRGNRRLKLDPGSYDIEERTAVPPR